MKIVAQQGTDRWMVYEHQGDPAPTDLVVVVDETQERSWRMAAASVLARGYWKEPTGPTPEARELVDRFTIVDVVP